MDNTLSKILETNLITVQFLQKQIEEQKNAIIGLKRENFVIKKKLQKASVFITSVGFKKACDDGPQAKAKFLETLKN